MVSSGMLLRVALVRTDVSEEPGASFIRVTRIGKLETTQMFLVHRFLSHGVTSQKTPFFIVTAVKTSNLSLEECLKNPRFCVEDRFVNYI
jgi:hypothetical protein